MNFPTSGYPTPAATPRTGPGFSELPCQDPGAKTQSLPFAALPHELRKDPRLKGNRTAIVLARQPYSNTPGPGTPCWPSNRRLAEDLGCCQQKPSAMPWQPSRRPAGFGGSSTGPAIRPAGLSG